MRFWWRKLKNICVKAEAGLWKTKRDWQYKILSIAFTLGALGWLNALVYGGVLWTTEEPIFLKIVLYPLLFLVWVFVNTKVAKFILNWPPIDKNSVPSQPTKRRDDWHGFNNPPESYSRKYLKESLITSSLNAGVKGNIFYHGS